MSAVSHYVGRNWGRPAVYDSSHVPARLVSVHQSPEAAEDEAARLNTPRRPTPAPAQQDALFDTAQEETA